MRQWIDARRAALRCRAVAAATCATMAHESGGWESKAAGPLRHRSFERVVAKTHL